MQTLRDWEALAKLDIGSAWSAEWLCVVDAPRPLASFKPADVIVIPLRNSEPHEFWRPSGRTPGRRPAPGPARAAEEAWEVAAEAVASDNELEEAADSDEGAPESEGWQGEEAPSVVHSSTIHRGVCA